MIQIAQYISSRVYVKKRRRSGLRRGFLTCTIGEIDKSRCVSYFSTVPKVIKIGFRDKKNLFAASADFGVSKMMHQKAAERHIVRNIPLSLRIPYNI